MKTKNRIISAILVCFLIMVNVPVVKAASADYEKVSLTQNGNDYLYYKNGSQYVRSGGKSNEYLNVWLDNAFFFMLTEPTQTFFFQQPLRMQCAYRISGSSLCFNELTYYTGQDLVGNIDAISIGTNSTQEFLSKNNLKVYWDVNRELDVKGSAQKVKEEAISNGAYVKGSIPWGYEFEVSFASVSGNTNYYWLGTASFEASEYMDKSFYYALSWYDEVSDRNQDSLTDRDNVTNQAIIENKIVVTDVYKLIEKVDSLNKLLDALGDNYSEDLMTQHKEKIAAIPKDMLNGTSFYTQAEVDYYYNEILAEENSILNGEKADYTVLDKAIADAEVILNDTSTVYTESSKNEVTELYNKAIALNRGLPVTEQTTINELAIELSNAVLGIKVKADYAEFDEAVENAKKEFEKGNFYTSSTMQALGNALKDAEDVSRDLSVDEQGKIDSVKNSVKTATEGLVEASDTTAFKKVINEAEAIIAEGNEKGRYDEDIWNNFIDSVNQAKKDLGENYDDIPKTKQEKVDEFTADIKTDLENIKNNRYIIVEFISSENVVCKSYRIKNTESKNFGDLKDIPEIPENTQMKKYIGWNYADGKTMSLTDAITDDVIVYCIEEEIKIIAKEDSDAIIDTSKGFVKGIRDGATVKTLVDSLENKSEYIVVKDKKGNPVESDSKIATGMTIELVSKTENGKINDIVTVVVKADVNGDGLVNDDDVEKSLDACCNRIKYTEDEKAYFEANDTNGDGVLDVLDAFNVSNMRYGNY